MRLSHVLAMSRPFRAPEHHTHDRKDSPPSTRPRHAILIISRREINSTRMHWAADRCGRCLITSTVGRTVRADPHALERQYLRRVLRALEQ